MTVELDQCWQKNPEFKRNESEKLNLFLRPQGVLQAQYFESADGLGICYDFILKERF